MSDIKIKTNEGVISARLSAHEWENVQRIKDLISRPGLPTSDSDVIHYVPAVVIDDMDANEAEIKDLEATAKE